MWSVTDRWYCVGHGRDIILGVQDCRERGPLVVIALHRILPHCIGRAVVPPRGRWARVSRNGYVPLGSGAWYSLFR